MVIKKGEIGMKIKKMENKMNFIVQNFVEAVALGICCIVSILIALFDWNIHMIPVIGMTLLFAYVGFGIAIDEMKELNRRSNEYDKLEKELELYGDDYMGSEDEG